MTHKERMEKFGKDSDRQNTDWSDIVRKCKHNWQPVSMVFETQLLDERGRVIVRQPDIVNGTVYLVCLKCYGHTYANTGWVGYCLGGPDELEAKR